LLGCPLPVYAFDAVGEALKALGEGEQLFLAAEIEGQPLEGGAAQLPRSLSAAFGPEPAIV